MCLCYSFSIEHVWQKETIIKMLKQERCSDFCPCLSDFWYPNHSNKRSINSSNWTNYPRIRKIEKLGYACKCSRMMLEPLTCIYGGTNQCNSRDQSIMNVYLTTCYSFTSERKDGSRRSRLQVVPVKVCQGLVALMSQ